MLPFLKKPKVELEEISHNLPIAQLPGSIILHLRNNHKMSFESIGKEMSFNEKTVR